MSSLTTTSKKRRFGRFTRPFSRRQQQRQHQIARSPNPSRHRLDYGALDNPPHSEDEEQRHHLPSLPNGDHSSIMSPRLLVGDESGPLLHDRNKGDQYTNDTNLDVVYTLERMLRQVLLILGSYCMGVYHPQWLPYLSRLTEWSGVAWVTCIVLLLMSMVQQHVLSEEAQPFLEQREQERYYRDDNKANGQQIPPLVTGRELDNVRTISANDEKALLDRSNDDVLETDVETGTITDHHTETILAPQNHPALEDLYIINSDNGERVYSNSSTAIKLDNELLEGVMLVMIRTYDCDDPKAAAGNAENQRVSNYLRSKQRRFEFQYQLRLKKAPDGRVYFGCEVEKMPKMGMVSKAFVGAAMSFMKRMNSGFHFNIGNETPTPDGAYERPHTSFTVADGFNRVVVTKPGQSPPKLGGEIHEDSDSMTRRKKHGIEWNTNDTYTFSLWSAYLDFLDWRAVNVPGMIRPVSLSSIFGMQPLTAMLYVVPHLKQDHKGPDKHLLCNINKVASIEISNTRESSVGTHAKEWIDKNKAKADMAFQDSTMHNVAEDDEDDDDEVPVDDEDDDEATVAELGEGMYLRSGDAIVLRESVGEDEEGLEDGNYVTNGGGFAVVQSQSSPTIVMEKARRSHARSKLIKNGDAVMIKMVSKNKTGDVIDVKYLSIHRGWWLKWVSIPPSKNGFFIVHTHDIDFDLKDGRPLRSPEPQNSFLTVGGTFWLRHRRWSKYQVGISAEESPTFGGRMLGLYRPNHVSKNDDVVNPDDEDDENKQSDIDDDVGLNGRAAKNKWMKPLRLNAQFPAIQEINYGFQTPVADATAPPTPTSHSAFNFSPEDQKREFGQFSDLDVPAWIEMMHRTERRPALVYVVRGVQLKVPTGSDPSGVESEEFLRLRTGRDLREIIRLGLSWGALKDRRRSARLGSAGEALQTPRTPTRSSSRTINGESGSNSPKITLNMPTLERESPSYPSQDSGLETSFSFHDDGDGKDNEKERESDAADSDDCSSVDSDEGSLTEEFEEVLPFDDVPDSSGNVSSAPKRKKGRKIIGQIAQKVKVRTTNTGKRVKKVGKGTVSAGKKVGKGTVTAGKAIIAPISRTGVRPNKPPAREPKSTGKGKRRKQERDHEVVNRAMKSMGNRSSLKWLSKPPSVLAGQLSAPEQSCRTVSHVLSETSNLPSSSAMSTRFNSMLTKQLASKSDLDRWFLKGGSIELGVVPTKKDQKYIHDCLIARCLWESHWREEWCGVYRDMVAFYAPLAKKPVLEIDFQDVQAVRLLEPDYGSSPLPGFPLVAIETAWRCHYLGFRTEEARDTFAQHLNSQIFSCESTGQVATAERKTAVDKAIWKARFWQGFQSSVESSMSGDHAKWAKIATMNKKKDRIILNSRRMVFDIEPIENENESSVCEFVENMLSTSLTFSLASLEEDPDAFVTFIDSTSRLRSLNLSSVDLGSEEGFCLFANLYHCLLQHAMLLSLDGPLHKRSISSVMHRTCYEIGGDVFSLAELRCCVLRGKMSRPTSQRPPYIEPPKKSSAYCFYALNYLDPRTNFLLNTGDLSCPPEIPVLRPLQLEQQVQGATAAFIQKELVIDVAKKTIFLPKVCDVYRNDYGNGDPTSILMYCLKYLEESEQKKIMRFVKSSDAVTKFQPINEQYYDFLIKRDDTSNTEDPSGTAEETLVHL